ncbi:glycosyltransferase [Xanthobacter sp. TB0139]|uniref:glycosyltransferase n=1 Tax=Xanthobacter sp. TB0139 TaxID=3459178 RepID=UPI004039A5D3
MLFAEIHRHFIAPHLSGAVVDIANDRLTLLYVGQGADHAIVLEAFHRLQRPGAVPLHLVLAGAGSGVGELSGADVSVHEQDGVAGESTFWPLLVQAGLVIWDGSDEALPHALKAMGADVPVVCLAPSRAGEGSALAQGIRAAGLEVQGRTPEQIAAAARVVLEEPWLRRELVRRQRAFLETLDMGELEAAFGPQPVSGAGDNSHIGGWRIEGPFDSSYSLAIVNRSLALELERQGEDVGLVSMDGPGRLPPDPAFLAAEPEVERLWQRAAAMAMPDVVTRNLYPPYALDMRGLTRLLSNYAWEESGFPPAHVAAFNSSLNLITTTSHFVTKVLRDNGVRVPIAMVGNGIFELPCELPRQQGGQPARDAAIYRYLHISSCFPRKGVDALLAAWARGFSRHDKVELVIKTFPNEHNDVAGQIEALQRDYPELAPIHLIEKDLDEADIHALYADADAVVCPARGEGFGLPMAEALAHGKPVVTTGFSGQRDFCTPETAWLCDFSFDWSRAHLGVTASVWAEPDVDSLIASMKAVRAAPAAEVAVRVAKGQALLHENYRWPVVASKTRTAVAALEQLDCSVLRLPKIGWVSTWNTRCGIATYSEALTRDIPPERLALFANRNAVLEGPDAPNVHRCWTLGWVADDLEELYAALRAEKVEALVLQFNLSFFPLEALCRLVERVEKDGVPVFLCFHSTMDVERPVEAGGGWLRLGEGRQSLARATRILVHSASDLNRLKAIGLVENVTLLPHGLPEPFAGDRGQMRHALGLEGRTVLATFGFLLPHKGLREIILAVKRMRVSRPDLHLLMLNALYPADVSRAELAACQALVKAEGLEDCVTIVSDFLEDEDIMARLSAADVIVYPYQNTQESASGAVRLGLASGTPVACTPLPIFEDVAPITRTLPGISPDELAAGLSDMLADREALAEQAERQAQWAAQIIWPVMRNRVEGMIRGLLLDRQMVRFGAPFVPASAASAEPHTPCLIHRPALTPRQAHYIFEGMAHVEGWGINAFLAQCLVVLDGAQKDAGLTGALFELGVHHGKTTALLAMLAGAEDAVVALDLFEGRQDENIDHSGQGNRALFDAHMQAWAPEVEVQAITANSLSCDLATVPALAAGIRLAHIDGAHYVEAVLKDLAQVEGLLCPGGIVVMDDFMHSGFPGVNEACNLYFSRGLGALVPLAMGQNKLFLTTPTHLERWQAALQLQLVAPVGKKVSFYGHIVLCLDAH